MEIISDANLLQTKHRTFMNYYIMATYLALGSISFLGVTNFAEFHRTPFLLHSFIIAAAYGVISVGVFTTIVINNLLSKRSDNPKFIKFPPFILAGTLLYFPLEIAFLSNVLTNFHLATVLALQAIIIVFISLSTILFDLPVILQKSTKDTAGFVLLHSIQIPFFLVFMNFTGALCLEVAKELCTKCL